MEKDCDSLVPAVAIRVPTVEGAFAPREEPCFVTEEGHVTVEVREVGTYVLMCTPREVHALAVGFLFSEGLIGALGDIATMGSPQDEVAVVRVELTREALRKVPRGGGSVVVSSAGGAGARKAEERISRLPRVSQGMRVEAELLGRVSRALLARQEAFKRCGGTRAAMVFDARGETLAFAEDMGRHNALDKAIGKRLLGEASCCGCGVMLSGRVSLEMVAKCARAGVELMAAVSAPTSLAVEAARSTGITLCGFVREQRASLFANPHRVRVAEVSREALTRA